MNSLRKLRRSVQWHEGMLLRPEHFQQADRRVEQILHFQIAQALPYYWGVTKFRIDDALLASGLFRIQEIEAIMPDGMTVVSHADDGGVLELDLNSYSEEFKAGNSLMVYICVPEYRMDAANTESEFPRYKSKESGFVINENTGEEAARFACLEPNLMIFAGERPAGRFVSMPIARIKKDKSSYTISDYIPPSLQVSPTSELGNTCSAITRTIRNKVAFLSEQVKNGEQSFLAQEAKEHIKTMASVVLGFEALLQTGKTHPYNLYVALCNMAGHLSALRQGEIPPALDPYDHDDISKYFNAVIGHINYCLDALQEGFSIIQFAKQDRVFTLELDRNWLADRLVIGVKGGTGLRDKDLIEWITSAVIATSDTVTSVRDKRILGAHRKIIEGDEEMSLLPGKNMILVEVENDPAFINPEEELQVFNVGDTPIKRPRDLVLYVPKQVK